MLAYVRGLERCPCCLHRLYLAGWRRLTGVGKALPGHQAWSIGARVEEPISAAGMRLERAVADGDWATAVCIQEGKPLTNETAWADFIDYSFYHCPTVDEYRILVIRLSANIGFPFVLLEVRKPSAVDTSELVELANGSWLTLT